MFLCYKYIYSIMNIDGCVYYVILNLCELKRNKKYYIVLNWILGMDVGFVIVFG